MKAYYDARAPRVRRLVARPRPLRRPRPARLGRGARASSARSIARCRPRARSTSPAAPASSRGTCRGEVTGLDQSDAMLDDRRASALPDATLRPGRRARRSRSRTAPSTASSPATSTATSRSAERVRFLAEARRVAPELVVVDAALRRTREPRGAAGADPQRRLALGRSTSASSTPDELADELGGGEIAATTAAGSSSSARRGDAAALELPLARLAPARQPASAARASRPATRSSRCRSSQPYARPARVHVRPGARRRRRAQERRPWRGRAGQTLRRWLELDEDEFYATFYCASVTRCYPGRAPSGRGDRTPTPREQELCAFWRDWELELIRPA